MQERTRSTVSVVIPVRNDAEVLRRCLRALARQTVAPDEIIVVDNGSSDESAAVAREHGARVIDQPQRGIGMASATGYDAARGEIIARLDADSVPGHDWIETILRAFARRPGVAAITGGGRFLDGPPRLRSLLSALYLGAYFALVSVALGHIPLFGSNMAIRRSAWLEVAAEVHRHDDLMHDDMDLAMHVGPARRIRFERGLRMEISMRPLTDPTGMRLRLKRGRHSIAAHWPRNLPPRRVLRRLVSAVRSR